MYHIDQVVEGTVSNVVDFGAFIVLPDGIEGLLHVTEMADGTLKEPHSYLKRGDTVPVKIVRIESERRRIGFTQTGLGLSHPTQRVGEPAAPPEEAPPAAEDQAEIPPDEIGEGDSDADQD